MENKKKAFKLNIIDIIITVLVAGIISVGAFMLARAFGVSAEDKDEIDVVYTLQFKGIENIYRGNVKVGDIIIDRRTRFNIGTVIEVDDSTPFYVDVFNEKTNQTVRAVHPEHHTLRLKIKTKAIKRNGAYYIQSQDFRLAVGLSVPMQAPDLCKSGFISDVQILNNK